MTVGLDDVVAFMRGPDAEIAGIRLADQLVTGQLRDTDEVLGLCWATVDLERTISDASLPFVPAVRDRLLGGSVASVSLGPLVLLVEEPDTEGRLAAFLARSGEGLCAVYVARAEALELPTRRISPTPIGRSGSLLAHVWPWGPFMIAVEPTA